MNSLVSLFSMLAYLNIALACSREISPVLSTSYISNNIFAFASGVPKGYVSFVRDYCRTTNRKKESKLILSLEVFIIIMLF